MVHLRRAVVLLVVLALVLAVGGAVAGAKKHKKKKQKHGGTWSSQVTLTLTTITHFEGTVSSQLDACRGQRLLTVYYGDQTTGQALPLSVQRTDSSGRYAFDLPKPAYPGNYQAVLIEERIKPKDKPEKCKGAESVALTVSG